MYSDLKRNWKNVMKTLDFQIKVKSINKNLQSTNILCLADMFLEKHFKLDCDEKRI